MLAALGSALLLWGPPAHAVDRSQTLPLAYGWNAVWLEVAPRDGNGDAPRAEEVFTSPEFVVDRIATPMLSEYPEFYETRKVLAEAQRGWRVWTRDPGPGETGIIRVAGHQAYLLHVSRKHGAVFDGAPAGSITITGEASFHVPLWDRDRYNLAGFGVEGRVSFFEVLSASGWTTGGKTAYRLDPATGNWVAVQGSDPVEPGRAYWISLPFQLGDTRYAGPVSVDFRGALLGRLNFGGTDYTSEIDNPAADPKTIQVSQLELTLTVRKGGASFGGGAVSLARVLPVASDPKASEMRLFRLERVPDELQWRAATTNGASVWDLGTVAPGTSRGVILGLNRNWSGGGEREHLYQIRVPVGSGAIRFDLPVHASSPEGFRVGTAPGAGVSLPGLWMGMIAIDRVTSLVETNGQPVLPTSSKPSISLLIHVGTNGVPVLLSRAMLMQTRTAAGTVPARQVILLSERQIPFFEGIEERRGKKVGVRFESPFFDLPRDWRPTAQGTELTTSVLAYMKSHGADPAQTEIRAGDLFDYLSTLKALRPSTLREAYCDRWPLEGTWAPGGGARTPVDAPLMLDGFHRSNPFRHAFHDQHQAGYPIRRSLVIRLDDTPFQGELLGDFEETLSGLATKDVVYRGRVRMQRISEVVDLQ